MSMIRLQHHVEALPEEALEVRLRDLEVHVGDLLRAPVKSALSGVARNPIMKAAWGVLSVAPRREDDMRPEALAPVSVEDVECEEDCGMWIREGDPNLLLNLVSVSLSSSSSIGCLNLGIFSGGVEASRMTHARSSTRVSSASSKRS